MHSFVYCVRRLTTGFLCLLMFTASVRAEDESLAQVAAQVNKKLVKLYGGGGFRNLDTYGTGVVVSPDGYILTISSTLLQVEEVIVHVFDGRHYTAKVMVTEPELDLAILKIKENVEGLPFYNIPQEAQKSIAEPGTAVIALSNLFDVATGDEPMSVMRGVISAYSKLRGRKGIFAAPYEGEVYFVDAITNNPGSLGGAVTNRKGELLGIIGKELKNNLSSTWINYCIPVQARIKVKMESGEKTLSMVDFVEKSLKGEYVSEGTRQKKIKAHTGYHGIVLVPNVVDSTPVYIESVIPDSPAAKAGLRPDDLIVYVDGEQVINIVDFNKVLNRAPPGTELKLEVRRGDRITPVVVRVENFPKGKK